MRRYSDRGLRRLGHDAQKIQRPAAALSFRVQAAQVLHQVAGGAGLVGQFLFRELPLARQIRGNRQIRLHGRKKLGAVLHHAGEALFNQAVQHLVDLLPRNVRAGRQFQRLEPGMPQQHEI